MRACKATWLWQADSMIFSTYWFVAAAAIFLPFYWLVKLPKIRLVLLLSFCFVFHAHFAGPAGMAPIVLLAIIVYCVGRTRNKQWCNTGIVLCLLALCFYKYTHFICKDMIAHLVPWLGDKADGTLSHWMPALPPLAISFFTFEFVHYLFEVRKGGEPISNFLEFTQFTFYFPSLVAGPIKRYTQFLPSLNRGLEHITEHDIASGLLMVAVGFFKKAVIADNLTLLIDHFGPRFGEIGLGGRWLLLVAIAFRIYLDFSGYSDMAIGFSRMMGISLPKNFNWPYVSRNIQEFWQRWHISLSSWIRDYVYIPLGGNRMGSGRRVLNGLVAFALCGLWHGAAVNFVFWGLYHGCGLAIAASYRKALGPLGRGLGSVFDKAPALSWALTMLFVGVGWLYFFYPFRDAWRMTKQLFRLA